MESVARPVQIRTGSEHEPRFASRFLRWIWIFYTRRTTRAGRMLIWPTVGFLAYTSASLDYQAFVPTCYVLALWGVALLARLYFWPAVRIQCCHPQRISAGETLSVDLQVENRGKRAGVDLSIQPWRLPHGIVADPADGLALPVLPPGRSAAGKLGLRCDARGVYRLSGYRCLTDFPFGVFCSEQILPQERALHVAPRFTPLRALNVPTGRRFQPGGIAMVAQTGDSMEFVGNRDYRDGDSLRDIDWRATARLQRPIVREYREEYFLRAAVILDTHQPPPAADARRDVASRTIAGQQACLEAAISMAAAIGDCLARRDYIIDLFAAGPDLYHLVAGRSLAYLDQILDILSCVNGSEREPFSVIAPELMHNLERIGSAVCILLDWNAERQLLVRTIQEQGVGVKVVIVRDTPCSMVCDLDPVLLTSAQVRSGILEL